ncbi:MAG TPA: hypothetical protein DCG69_07070, partial [Bacteroidales bacterium]|nr:hypothetical protein [Bacteroidales bacterium]
MMGEVVALDGNTAVMSIGNRSLVEVLEFDGNIWKKVAVLTPSDESDPVSFGSSLCVSNNVIIVGSPDNLTYGAVYVFQKPVSGWTDMTETAKLTASDGENLDNFGFSVSLSNNVLVVGAFGDDDNGMMSGAAYIFEKPVDEWISATETVKVKPSDGAATNYFGRSVSISGETLVIGAVGKKAAYVFEKPSTGWVNLTTETATLTSSDIAIDDSFGETVSISGNTIVVGVYDDDDLGSNSGSAYVFEKPSSGWVTSTQTAKLTASNGTSNDFFGVSVSVSGNFIAIGASNFEGTGVFHGAVYLFEKPVSGVWVNASENQMLKAADEDQYDQFGKSVSLSHNFLLVGAFQADYSVFFDSGSAYLFQAPITWTGSVSSDWHTAANWDFESVPNAFDDVLVDDSPSNQPEINTQANCYDLQLDTDASLTLLSDVSTSASLIIGGIYSGAAKVAYQRFMEGNLWYFTGSPFEDTEINTYISHTNLLNDGTNYKMKDYIESTDAWAPEYTMSTLGIMQSGKGFAVKLNSSDEAYFIGTPNTSTVNVSLTRDGMG